MTDIIGEEDSEISTPIQAFITYFNEVKPYHTKILEVLEQYNFVDPDAVSNNPFDVDTQLLINFAESVITYWLTPTNTVTVTPTSTVTPTLTPTSTVTPTVTPTLTPTHTPTASVTPTNTATPTASVTPTLVPTTTPTRTPPLTPEGSQPTPAPTATSTATPGVSVTSTPTPTATPTATTTPTVTPTSGLVGNVNIPTIVAAPAKITPTDLFFFVQWMNDGSMRYAYNDSPLITVPGSWWSLEPVSSVGDLFEIRLAALESDPGIVLNGGASVGTWVPMPVSPASWSLEVTGDAPMTGTAIMVFQIRDAATTIVQDSNSISVNFSLLDATPTPTPTNTVTPTYTVTPTITPSQTLSLPLAGGNYAVHGTATQGLQIQTWARFNSDGTITTPTTGGFKTYFSTFPSSWLNSAPGDPTIYWFRVVVTAENYVSGAKFGTYSAWVQMPLSGFIQWGNICSYNHSNGAGEAETEWTLEIAIGAGGSPVDNCTGYISSVTTGGGGGTP